jgi:choline dehydrogenase-like flavoprotein
VADSGLRDVVIIGGGHNGLVCAAYLASAGLKVTVLERRSVVGGAAVTEEFHPGFRNSVAAYTVSLLNPKVIRDLDLPRHGRAGPDQAHLSPQDVDELGKLIHMAPKQEPADRSDPGITGDAPGRHFYRRLGQYPAGISGDSGTVLDFPAHRRVKHVPCRRRS